MIRTLPFISFSSVLFRLICFVLFFSDRWQITTKVCYRETCTGAEEYKARDTTCANFRRWLMKAAADDDRVCALWHFLVFFIFRGRRLVDAVRILNSAAVASSWFLPPLCARPLSMCCCRKPRRVSDTYMMGTAWPAGNDCLSLTVASINLNTSGPRKVVKSRIGDGACALIATLPC